MTLRFVKPAAEEQAAPTGDGEAAAEGEASSES
jgi:hypothetical protein